MKKELSPSEYLDLPILGQIICHIKGEKDNKPHFFLLGSHDVIFIEKNEEDVLFWCNVWEKDEPLKVSSKYIKSFIKNM